MGFGLGALGVLGNAQALNPQKLFQTMGLVFMTPKSVSQSVIHKVRFLSLGLQNWKP